MTLSPREAAVVIAYAAARVGALRSLGRRNDVMLNAADAHVKSFAVSMRYAFARARKALKGVAPDKAPAAARRAVAKAMAEVLVPALLKPLAAGGRAGAGLLAAGLERGRRAASGVPEMNRRYEGLAAATEAYRAAGPLKYKFNVQHPQAIAWVKEHAAELAKELSETTERDIRLAMTRSYEDGEDPYDAILEAVGDDARAELIARTETMIAANQGQREAWDQAVEKGLLDEDAQRVWITTPGCCDECEALDGETASLNEDYPDPGGEGPPLHPNCRCTEGIRG